MVANAFLGQARQPTESELTAALGRPARALWDQLRSDLKKHEVSGEEWNSSSRKAGWALRLKRGQRNIVYLSPNRGGFTASFALGERAGRSGTRGRHSRKGAPHPG